MHIPDLSFLATGGILLMLLCLFAAAAFEFVNGFHDTANAVATVIYTHSLPPRVAVIWSGLMNFLGVVTSVSWFGMAVAMGIIKLLPLSSMIQMPQYESISIVLAVLVAAIIWNIGTWYLGLPSSSSHTMIGAILGVGIVFSFLHPGGDGVNWTKAQEIGLSLLLSPAFGFSVAIGMMYILTKTVRNKAIFHDPKPGDIPPLWIRAILIGTCTLVSFFHGSNDGQKGVGLVMIILIAFLPLQFALDGETFNRESCGASLRKTETILLLEAENNALATEIKGTVNVTRDLEQVVASYDPKDTKQVSEIRKRLQLLTKNLKRMVESDGAIRNHANRKALKKEYETLKDYTEYAPIWVLVAISLSLGLGTMVGWKRIVITIGEKIGKSHLTYAQGATAEIIAASTIGLSTAFGLPVSTTHVLSSGVAGTMVASSGVKNLQGGTIRNIALAWLLTLPVSMLLAGGLYALFRLI